MNLNSFEYFCAIAEERSFTAAARRLHVTQQTLSAHIAALERELGHALLVRRNPLELTHEGEIFLAHAHGIEADLIDMQRELSGEDNEQTGTLHLGIAHTRGRVILPDAIRALTDEFPSVSVQLHEGSNVEINRALTSGELDLAIGSFEHRSAGIELLGYYDEQVALLASDALLESCGLVADKIAPALARGDLSPLAQCPFVLGPPEDITGELALHMLTRANFAPRVRVRSSNMETLLALALRGVGASLSPVNLVEATATPEQKLGLRLFDLGPLASYRIDIALPAREYRWKPVERFVEIALSQRAQTPEKR